MKCISWNIDSLNAALTGNSKRALLSRKVLNTIIEYNPEVIAVQETKLPSTGPTKKHLEILKDKFSDYDLVWNCSQEPALKGYAGTIKEIDLAHPDSNRRSAGFTDEERQGFTSLLAKGFIDTFRYIHENVRGAYTWWAQRAITSKINNSGWRIDYWIVSERIANNVLKTEMIDSGPRQDHTPIFLEIDI